MKSTSLLSRAGHIVYFHLLRGAERLLGPGVVFSLITPEILFICLKRWRDFPQFRLLRAALPLSFWKGVSPARHFVRMFRIWNSSLVVALFYDRLNFRTWRQRLTIRGNPPSFLSERDGQPVVIAFFHTGGFPILRSWLRAQGVPAALYLGEVPRLAHHAKKLRENADRLLKMEGVPHHFTGSRSLREAVRFLKPGRALLVALEERDFRQPDVYAASGLSICLNRVAFRLALLSGALLLPAAVRECGRFRFEITFGPPVPASLMHEKALARANQYLLDELWPDLEDDPTSLTWTILEAMSPHLTGKRRAWP